MNEEKLRDVVERLNKSARGSNERRKAIIEALQIMKEASVQPTPQKSSQTEEITKTLNEVMQHPDTCDKKELGCNLCEGKKKISQVQEELQTLIRTGKPPAGGLLEQAKRYLDESQNTEKVK